MIRRGRSVNPRILAARALQRVRLARMSIARLKHRLSLYGEAREGDVESILRNLSEIENILEYIMVKLEVFVATGVALSDTIGKAAKASRKLVALAPLLPPQVSAVLMEVDESIRGLLDAGEIPLISDQREPIGEEAAKILEEAEAIARQRHGETEAI